MVEAAAQRSRLIADGGRSEKERDAGDGGESGEGNSSVLYTVPGAWQFSQSGALGALTCMGQLTGELLGLRISAVVLTYIEKSVPT